MTPHADDRSPKAEQTRSSPPEHVPGDELYMITGDEFVLCSVQYPSTRWIAMNSIVDLYEWR